MKNKEDPQSAGASNSAETSVLLIDAAAAAIERAVMVLSDRPDGRSGSTRSSAEKQKQSTPGVRSIEGGQGGSDFSAVRFCLDSIGALLEVSRKLLNDSQAMNETEQAARLAGLVTDIKAAGSDAYHAALVLSDPRPAHPWACAGSARHPN